MDPDQNITNQEHKNFLKFMKFPNSYVQSFDDRRGQLQSVNYYKEGMASPIKKEEYLYDYQVRNSLKVTKPFYFVNSINYDEFSASNYVLTYFNNIKKNIKEDFFPGGSVKEENTFNYDEARLIYKKTVTDSDTVEEFYKNAKDKSIQKLVNANILDTNIEIEKKKNGKLLSKQETKYDNSASLLPNAEVSYNLENNTIPITDINYDKYDTNGNLIQYTTKDGKTIGLVWGYNKTLPIAKIEGKDTDYFMTMFSDENNALSIASNNDVDPTTEDQFRTKLDIFQSRQNGFKVTITTYTHNPLVGITSMTDPTGIRKFYKYDSANKLEQVINTDRKVIKEYKYNYSTVYYNNEKSQSFTRANCGPGTLPTPTVYTVPLGKYSSTISQADADQKAQNDILTNGQSYINANGVCTPYVCSITPSYNTSIYYSSFQETAFGHIKAILSFPVSSFGGSAPSWSNGVFIGTLGDLCRPSSYKNIGVSSDNGYWNVSLGPDGSVRLTSNGGGGNPGNSGSVTLYFEYDKN